MDANNMRDGGRAVVLHVVEAFGGGVAAAVRDHVRNTPEYEHHLLCHMRQEASTLEAGWDRVFDSVTHLSRDHLSNLTRTRRLIRSLRPDVIHSQSNYGGAYARLAAGPSADVKQVHTPHGWPFERQDKGLPVRVAYWAIEALLALNTDVVAGVSRAETRAAQWGPVRPRTVYLPNITPVPLAPVPTKPRGEQLIVAVAGRVAAQKDPEFFIACMRVLKDEGHDIHPLWIGGGDVELTRKLVDAGVEVTGWIEHSAVIAHMRRADVFLHSAQFDGFPITIIEAATLGLPVIVRRIPAFQDTGLPVLLESPDDLRQLWQEFVDPAARAQFSEWTRAALWENQAEIQRRRLHEAYGL